MNDRNGGDMDVQAWNAARHLSALPGLEPVWGVPLPAEAPALAEHLDNCVGSGEPGAFVVMRDARVMALVVGEATACGYRAGGVHTRRGHLARGLLDAVRQTFAGQRLELSVTAESEPPGLQRRLSRHGFVPVLHQVHHHGRLDTANLSATGHFDYHAYSSADTELLLDTLERIWGEAVSPAGRAPREELEEWLAAAEAPEGSGTELWRLAHIDGEVAGVALAQLWNRASAIGSMVYIGLVPERRGQGLGAALHQDALRLLRRAGATTYVDSTQPDNAAMRRLLEQVGCRPTGSERIYSSREALPATRITGPHSLIRAIRRLGLPVQALSTGHGTRTVLRRPGGPVPIDVRWDSDAAHVDLDGVRGGRERLSLDRRGSLDAVTLRVGLWRTARRALSRTTLDPGESAGTLVLSRDSIRPADPPALLHAVPVNAGARAAEVGPGEAHPEDGQAISESFVSLGEPTRLSRSPVWELQRQYFIRAGVDAWASGRVPHYVTSNPYIARSYARVAAAFVEDCRLAGALSQDEPVHVIELGSGTGRFAHRFLIDFVPYLAGRGVPDVCYVATDLADSTLGFLSHHPQLRGPIDAGQLTLARFDAPNGPLTRFERNDRLGDPAFVNPTIVIANYFWDGLPQDSFAVRNGGIQEQLVTISLPERAVAERVAHLALDTAQTEWIHGPAARPHYAEAVLEQVLDEHLALPDGTMFLMPTAAMATTRTLTALSPAGMLVLSADRGSVSTAQLARAPSPTIVHHGSLSLDVNYFALGAWADRMGARTLSASATPGSLAVHAQVHGPMARALARTPVAFSEHLDGGGPDDFFQLKPRVIAALATASLSEILAYLRLSVWDSKIFMDLLPTITARSAGATGHVTSDAVAVAEEISRRHLELPGDGVASALEQWRRTLEQC